MYMYTCIYMYHIIIEMVICGQIFKRKYGICMYLYIHIYRSGNLWSNFLGDVHVNVDTLYMYSTCKLNFLLTGFSYRWSNRTPLELKVHVIKYIA